MNIDSFGWQCVSIIIMEINMNQCQQVIDSGDMALQLELQHQDEGQNLELISSPAVDQPIQSLTVLETQLQLLVPSPTLFVNRQSQPVSDLSCNYSLMTASSAPLSLQAFLLELQEDFLGRREMAFPQLSLKVNRIRRKCSICQQLVKKNQVIAHLRCKHVFHGSCLSIWQKRSTRCPLCRKNML